MNTRDMIREFNLAFGRPVNESLANISVTDRELLGKLLLEETLEYVTEGLGLSVVVDMGPSRVHNEQYCKVEHVEGVLMDMVEVVDGLADVNVIAHFAAHWHGFNLDRATEIVNDSNMSKLDEDGKAIINGVTEGYRTSELGECSITESGFDPTKPIGKILKGPNFYEPGPLLRELIQQGDNQ